MEFDPDAQLFVTPHLHLTLNISKQTDPTYNSRHGADELGLLCLNEEARRWPDRHSDVANQEQEGLFDDGWLYGLLPEGFGKNHGSAMLTMFVAALPTAMGPAVVGCRVGSNPNLVTNFFPYKAEQAPQDGVIYLIVRRPNYDHLVVDAVMPNWDVNQHEAAYYGQTHTNDTVHELLQPVL